MRKYLLDSALHKLRWSWLGGEWAAHVKPNECEMLLQERDEHLAEIAYLRSVIKRHESPEAVGAAVRSESTLDDAGLGVTPRDASAVFRRPLKARDRRVPDETEEYAWPM